MFKLIKMLGKFVAKMYTKQATILVAKSKAQKSAAEAANREAAELLSVCKRLHSKSGETSDEAARVALQGQTLSKFFE